ncbi:MAG TPA: NlpC/P60 family protein [Mycobacteriales bacterium]|nr:NlpC/P60 family protein [Mycobacteriales bacterium]
MNKPRNRMSRAAALGLATATALASVLIAGPFTHRAAADPIGDARAQAAALAQQVHDLRIQAEQASEAYDAAEGQLQAAVSRHLTAQKEADAAQQAVADQVADAGARARALYENGGALGLYAQLLNTGDPGTLLERLQGVRHVVARVDAAGARVHAASDAAKAKTQALQTVADDQIKLAQQAADAAGKVRAALTAQQALLDNANQQVRTLEKQAEELALARAQQQFSQQLQAARAAAGLPLVIPASDEKASSPLAARAIAAILTHIGAPYLWGGTGPAQFDCSGLTGAAYFAAGLRLPRTAAQQYLSGPHPTLDQLRPGDLLFWGDPGGPVSSIHHVAMYYGNGLMVSTNHTGDVARVQPIWGDGFYGVTRPTPDLVGTVAGPQWSPGDD